MSRENTREKGNNKTFIPYFVECIEEIANRHEKRNMDLKFYICEFYEELGRCLFSGYSIETMPTKYAGIKKIIVELSRIPSVDGYTLMGVSQYLLNYEMYKDDNKWVMRSGGETERKQLGSYYTPVSLTEQLCKTALLPVADRLSNDGQLHQIKICDPSCGGGVFLVTALRILAEKYKDHFPEEWKESNLKAHIARNCLYGVDLNSYAVLECKLNLCLECKEGLYF